MERSDLNVITCKMQTEHSGNSRKYGVPKDWSMLLFVGRLSWVKGARNLLLAMPSVLKEFPNTKLVILGKGDEQDIIEQQIG
jgi:glycosyltransferase involved in cell wall biosynthesis